MELLQQQARPLKRCLILVCAGALTGCATVVDIAERHGDANLVQERVMNQQLLLNIVRASHRQPLHFSRIPYIKLPLISSAPWELNFPFGVVGAYGRNSAKSTVGGALITVEVAPQDSQEFMQGITTPVGLNLMNLYFQQGWPKQLVLYLFVEELRVVQTVETCDALKQADDSKKPVCDPNKKPERLSSVIERIRNNPGKDGELADFAKAIDTITKCELFVRSDSPSKGPRLADPWTAPVSSLLEATNAGLIGPNGDGLSLLVPGLNRLELRRPAGVENAPDCELPGSSPSPQALVGASANGNAIASTLLTLLKSGGATERGKAAQAGNTDLGGAGVAFSKMGVEKLEKKTLSVEIATRSPDGMVYYLGEVLRHPGKVTVARDGDPKSRAFLFGAQVSEATTMDLLPKQAAVWVDYWDRRYSIPRPNTPVPSSPGVKADAPKDRSMQALALVGQILQLQNKAAVPPRSAAFRVEP